VYFYFLLFALRRQKIGRANGERLHECSTVVAPTERKR
jgi:hypothetical protein